MHLHAREIAGPWRGARRPFSRWRLSALSLVLITPNVQRGIAHMVQGIVKDEAATESILADAITRAIERIESDKPTHFIAWLYGIARNMSFHWIRAQKKVEALPEQDPIGPARSGDAEVLTREAFEIFERDLARLTPTQRDALRYRIIDRLTFEEVGRQLRIAPGAARALVFRARRGLTDWREYMRPAEDDLF